MLRILSNATTVEERYGFRPQDSLLFSAIRLDSHPFVTPLIVEGGDEEILLVRQQEQGNVLSAGVPAERIRFYEPWVTIDARIVEDWPASPSLPALVKELSGDEGIELDSNAPYVHYLALAGEVAVTVSPSEAPAVTVYEVDQDLVKARFARWRTQGVAVAARLIADVPHLAGLEADLGADTDNRFDGLTSLGEELGVTAALLSSPPNFTEVTGTRAQPDEIALWLADGNRVLVIADASNRGVAGTPLGSFDSAADAIHHFAGDAHVAFEEQWETTALALALTQRNITLVSASRPLGSWRDVRDSEDLAFHVIAARASVTAIEAAVAWAHEQLDAGIETNEREMYAVYLSSLDAFRLGNSIPFAIEPYFTNLHSSSRMLFPGPPVDFPLNSETKCIQLDAGVKVTIDGVTVATSDMARSVLRSEEGKEAYEILTKAVREGIIATLRPGVICEDVHASTLEYLDGVLPRMIEIGLLGPEVDFNTEYRKRNVGHLMGKQESFANELRPGYTHVLAVGSYGAAEIPWRYGEHAIGTEDLWFIGSERTYNLTLAG